MLDLSSVKAIDLDLRLKQISRELNAVPDER